MAVKHRYVSTQPDDPNSDLIGTGEWNDAHVDTQSVTYYGAVGDGITDDTAAIQAAINANSTVVFPAGSFKVGALTLKSDLSIVGAGIGKTVLTLAASTNGHMFAGLSLSDITFAGLTLDANGANQTDGNCLRFESCTNVEIRDCHVKSAFGHNVYFLGTSSNSSIRDCIVSDAVTAAASNGVTVADTCSGILIADCLMYDNAQNAIYIGGNNHRVIGNHCYGSGQTNIKVWKGDKHIIANNNSHEAVLGSGIHVDFGANNVTVTGNLTWGNAEHGIMVLDTTTACSSATVTGNTSRSNTLNGIYLRGAIGSTVSGNSTWNNGGVGVSLVSVDTVAVNGNTSKNDVSAYSVATSSSVLAVGNSWQRSSAAPETGTWPVGEVRYNTVPAAGAYFGWVCVTAGTPGTWKGFGLIETP